MSSDVQQAVSHGISWPRLDAADIGNCCNVVVVEPMAKTKNGCRNEREAQVSWSKHERGKTAQRRTPISDQLRGKPCLGDEFKASTIAVRWAGPTRSSFWLGPFRPYRSPLSASETGWTRASDRTAIQGEGRARTETAEWAGRDSKSTKLPWPSHRLWQAIRQERRFRRKLPPVRCLVLSHGLQSGLTPFL